MIRVLVADDHAVVRRGVIEILLRELQKVKCSEAENAEQVLAKIVGSKWDLLILDVSMPGRSGIAVLGDLKRLCPKLPVLMLSMFPEGQYAQQALKAGASAYLNKMSAPKELAKTVRKVLAGAAI